MPKISRCPVVKKTFLPFLASLVLLSGCAPSSRHLVLMDPVFPLADPAGAEGYRSFRFKLSRGTLCEYPSSEGGAFLDNVFAGDPPEAVLVSPLLSGEFAEIRRRVPDAWILGAGLPEGDRTVSVSWDTSSAAREAGQKAADALCGEVPSLIAGLEVVILQTEGSPDSEESGRAFLEGFQSRFPEAAVRRYPLTPSPSPEDLETAVRGLLEPGCRAVFFNAGAAGLKAAELLDHRDVGTEPVEQKTRITTALRLPYFLELESLPADVVVRADSRSLIRVLKSAYREAVRGNHGVSRSVPESLSVRSAQRP